MATTNLEWTSTASNSGFTTPDNVAAADDSRATGAVAGDQVVIELDNAPGDYNDTNSGNTVTLRVQARTQGTVDRQKQVVLTLTNSGGTAIQDSGAANITFTTSNLTGSDADYTSSAFTLANNYTAANVNGWRLKADITEGGGMPDSATVDIDYMAVVPLDYDVGGTSFNQSAPATVAAVASITKSTAMTEAATVSAVGGLTKQAGKIAAGTTVNVGSITKTTSTTKAASVSATADITKKTTLGAKAAVVAAVAVQNASIVFTHAAAAVVAAVATFASTVAYVQSASASVSAVASLVKHTTKGAFAAVVAAGASLATQLNGAGGAAAAWTRRALRRIYGKRPVSTTDVPPTVHSQSVSKYSD